MTTEGKIAGGIAAFALLTRVLLVGDSMAQGLTAPMKEQSTTAFSALAKPGTRIDQWLSSAQLKSTLASYKPTLVIIVLGTNDAYSNANQAQWIDPFVAKLRAAGADVVWVGPPSLPNPYSGMPVHTGFLQTLAQKAPRYFHSETLSLPRADTLHPTQAGFQTWAKAIWATL